MTFSQMPPNTLKSNEAGGSFASRQPHPYQLSAMYANYWPIKCQGHVWAYGCWSLNIYAWEHGTCLKGGATRGIMISHRDWPCNWCMKPPYVPRESCVDGVWGKRGLNWLTGCPLSLPTRQFMNCFPDVPLPKHNSCRSPWENYGAPTMTMRATC